MKFTFLEWSEERFREGCPAAKITANGLMQWVNADRLRWAIREHGEDPERVKALHQYGLRENYKREEGAKAFDSEAKKLGRETSTLNFQ